MALYTDVEMRTHVEEVVGASELLTCLQSHTQDGSVKGLVWATEAVKPAGVSDLILVVNGVLLFMEHLLHFFVFSCTQTEPGRMSVRFCTSLLFEEAHATYFHVVHSLPARY